MSIQQGHQVSRPTKGWGVKLSWVGLTISKPHLRQGWGWGHIKGPKFFQGKYFPLFLIQIPPFHFFPGIIRVGLLFPIAGF